MKRKKWLSLFMAVALLVSGLPQTGSIAAASAVTVSEEEEQLPAETEVSEKEQSPEDSENPEETEEQDSEKTIDEEKAQLPTEQESGEEEQTSEESGSEEEVQTPAETEDKEEEQAPDETEDKEEEQTPTETEGEEEAQTPIETEGEEEAQTPTETEGEEEVQAPAETEGEEEAQTPTETESEEEAQAPEETEGEEEVQALEETEGEEEVQVEEEELVEEKEEMGIIPLSMLPLEEKRAYLVISDIDNIDLTAVPLGMVLDNLRDSEGNSIEIPESATTVWTYFKDENENILQDEYHVIGRDEEIDLSSFENVTSYTMELIIGSGNQLDSNNIRYIVKVYLIGTVTETREYELYIQNEDGTRMEVVPEREQETYSSLNGIDVSTTLFSVPDHKKGKEYYLGITSLAAEHPDISVDIYTFEEFIKLLSGLEATAITGQILNRDMGIPGVGYKGVYDVPDGIYDWKNMFAIVYRNSKTDEMISFQVLNFVVSVDYSYVSGNIYEFAGAEMQDVVFFEADSFDLDEDFQINPDTGELTKANGVIGLSYMLKEGYSADDEYYCILDAHSSEWGDEANEHVIKAVTGHYDTLESAAEQVDIKSQLIPVDRSTLPYGYKANYNYLNQGVDFTIFFDDSSVMKFNIKILEYDSSYDESYMMSFTKAPVVGKQDPWFRVIGAKQENETLDTYIVENGKAINMDTMYGYGYQTILINNEDVDLSTIQPVFWYANAERIEAYVNGRKQESGVDSQDFLDGSVLYNVIIDDNVKNYQVEFVKKTSEAKLYVAGPDTREIFLDEYFEYKHDIFLANVGNEKLTGLKVELDATNVKLDDYWTVGGNKNDTLAPFTTTVSTAEYGELSNMAKIRLLPDGEGEISGTLTISADNQEPVVIKLTGRAQNPQITTNNLDDAVKYVPYSYLISTNNMYDWNDVEFIITSGSLPEGVQLYPTTGEIYGAPLESGEFPICVKAVYSKSDYFKPSEVELNLVVKDNTNDNVYYASDDGYDILDSIGVDTSNNHDYVLSEIGDEIFRSSGVFEEFIDLWLNGERLILNENYTVDRGSTKITVKDQTFKNKAKKDGTNTIAAEFRVGGDKNNNLKCTAQNFRLDIEENNSDNNMENDGNSGTEVDNGNDGIESDKENNSGGDNSGNGSFSDENDGSSGGNNSGAGNSGNGSFSDGNDGSSGGNNSGAGNSGNESFSDGSNSGNGGSSNETDISSADAQGSTVGNTADYISLIVRLTDTASNPLADMTVELHSTPKTARTNQNGIAVFTGVESGHHTLFVKDQNGNILASREFDLQFGTAVMIQGNQITAVKGSSLTLDVQAGENGLTFFSAQNGDVYQVLPTGTGDESNPGLWMILAFAACAMGFLVLLHIRKKKKVL